MQMLTWSWMSGNLRVIGWVFPAALAALSLMRIARKNVAYRKHPTPANKLELAGARKQCVLWLVATALVGAVCIYSMGFHP